VRQAIDFDIERVGELRVERVTGIEASPEPHDPEQETGSVAPAEAGERRVVDEGIEWGLVR